MCRKRWWCSSDLDVAEIITHQHSWFTVQKRTFTKKAASFLKLWTHFQTLIFLAEGAENCVAVYYSCVSYRLIPNVLVNDCPMAVSPQDTSPRSTVPSKKFAFWSFDDRHVLLLVAKSSDNCLNIKEGNIILFHVLWWWMVSIKNKLPIWYAGNLQFWNKRDHFKYHVILNP